jgi:hypothetical protein
MHVLWAYIDIIKICKLYFIEKFSLIHVWYFDAINLTPRQFFYIVLC